MLNGLWWNPDYAGEGFIFSEEDDRVIGYYFTYETGEQAWYLLDCTRLGTTISGKVYRPEGGEMGSTLNPNTVSENEVGQITLIDDDGLNFDARIEGQDLGYDLVPLFGVEEQSPPSCKIEKRYGNSWLESDVPVVGTSQVNDDDIQSATVVFEWRISALTENIILEDAITSGPQNPAWVTPPLPHSIEAGTSVVVKAKMGPITQPIQGQWTRSTFRLESNKGVLIDIQAQVS